MLGHFVLQETENECLLDMGHTGVQRKVYLRELAARFGHHLAVSWNLGEENGPARFSPIGQTDAQKKAMASYIKETNPYLCNVVLHTHSGDEKQDLIKNAICLVVPSEWYENFPISVVEAMSLGLKNSCQEQY